LYLASGRPLWARSASQACQYLHFCTGKASKLRRLLCTCRAVCDLPLKASKASKASKLSSVVCTLRAVCELLHRPATFLRASACSFPTLILRPYDLLPPLRSAYVSIRQHASAYVSMRQHTSAYVSRHVPALNRARRRMPDLLPPLEESGRPKISGTTVLPAATDLQQSCNRAATELQQSCNRAATELY